MNVIKKDDDDIIDEDSHNDDFETNNDDNHGVRPQLASYTPAIDYDVLCQWR